MPYNDELMFEHDFISLLKNHGWESSVIYNPTEEDLVKNWADILFNNNREKDVLNGCPLTDGEMAQILNEVSNLRTPMAINKFINGKTVSITRDNEADALHFGKAVSLKIYDRMEIAGGKSRYQIVEQPRFKTDNSIYPTRRGDVMLLINGMPLFHIELKRSDVSITQAEVQIEKYMENGVFSSIFSMVQIFVAMNPEEAVYYANPGRDGKFNPDYYFHWEDFSNNIVNEWSEFTKQFLSIPMAHQMIGFYTISDDTDGTLKVMRSYQYWGASKISAKVAATNWTKSDQHGGFVWHTTGSGKTMTSFKAAQLIANSRDADKVVFLLDRIELGDQSLNSYRNFADPSDTIQATEDTNVLISKLKSDSSDCTLIVTSIQKMSRIREDAAVKDADLKKIQSKRIVFIIDECHRDQSGEMHQNVKKTFPNAIYFGFTGTPDHNTTVDIFGDELHRYAISHGIRDGNVLGLDPYMVTTFKEKELRECVGLKMCNCKTVDEAMARDDARDLFLYYMNKTKTPCTMKEIESLLPTVQYETEKHEIAVVQDILDNWAIRSLGKFHAIMATSSIIEAIRYYRLFKELIERDGLKLKVSAVFDPSETNTSTTIAKMKGITEILTDYNNTFGKKYEIGSYANFKKDLCARLAHKSPYYNPLREEQIDIVIVVDQLLTGFDSKWINTLYLDKMLDGKNLIQAISRTNRVFGPGKPHGILVYYRKPYTLKDNLDEAIASYAGTNEFSIYVDKLDKNLTRMNGKFEEIKDLFETEGIKDFERISDSMAWQKKFVKLFSEFNRYLNSAKLQGFVWERLSYEFKKPGCPAMTITLKLDEKIYLTLVQRYKEIFKGGGGKREVPFDIDTYIVEIKTDTFDVDYINERFNIYVLELNNGDAVTKEKTLQELHKSFASLSQEDQKFANLILTDLETGKLKVEKGKAFRDYLTEYKCRAYNDQIHALAAGLGVNEEKLRSMMSLHLNESNINEYGRFDDLKDTLNIEIAQTFLSNRLQKDLSKKQAKIEADKLLKRFIIEGGFPV